MGKLDSLDPERRARLKKLFQSDKKRLIRIETAINTSSTPQNAIEEWITIGELEECGNFEGSGFPIRDRCKHCGAWTITREGLKAAARELQLGGTTGGSLYRQCVQERREAVAHGVIQDNEFKIETLNKLIIDASKRIKKNEISQEIAAHTPEVFITLGAGDIGLEINGIKKDLAHAI